jgi:hypothetical protein
MIFSNVSGLLLSVLNAVFLAFILTRNIDQAPVTDSETLALFNSGRLTYTELETPEFGKEGRCRSRGMGDSGCPGRRTNQPGLHLHAANQPLQRSAMSPLARIPLALILAGAGVLEAFEDAQGIQLSDLHAPRGRGLQDQAVQAHGSKGSCRGRRSSFEALREETDCSARCSWARREMVPEVINARRHVASLC